MSSLTTPMMWCLNWGCVKENGTHQTQCNNWCHFKWRQCHTKKWMDPATQKREKSRGKLISDLHRTATSRNKNFSPYTSGGPDSPFKYYTHFNHNSVRSPGFASCFVKIRNFVKMRKALGPRATAGRLWIRLLSWKFVILKFSCEQNTF